MGHGQHRWRDARRWWPGVGCSRAIALIVAVVCMVGVSGCKGDEGDAEAAQEQLSFSLVPDEQVIERLRQANGPDIARHILEEYAIRAYQARTLSEAQLRRLLGFATRYELEDFLAAHQVPRNYMLEDLQQDRLAAQELGL